MRTKELIAYRHHTCVVPFQDDSSMCFLLLKPGISSCNSISLWTYFNSGFHPSHSIPNAQFTIFTLPRKTIGSPSQNTQLIYLKLSWSLLVFLPISSGTGLQLSIFFLWFFFCSDFLPSKLTPNGLWILMPPIICWLLQENVFSSPLFHTHAAKTS